MYRSCQTFLRKIAQETGVDKVLRFLNADEWRRSRIIENNEVGK